MYLCINELMVFTGPHGWYMAIMEPAITWANDDVFLY